MKEEILRRRNLYDNMGDNCPNSFFLYSQWLKRQYPSFRQSEHAHKWAKFVIAFKIRKKLQNKAVCRGDIYGTCCRCHSQRQTLIHLFRFYHDKRSAWWKKASNLPLFSELWILFVWWRVSIFTSNISWISASEHSYKFCKWN